MIDHTKYKWFYTKSGKLVVGGKSASQNDELLINLKRLKENHVVMHTSSPGSPFCVILSQISEATKTDIEECAIFTASFSQAWKQKKKAASIDIFKLSDLHKSKSMKTGTWSLSKKPERLIAGLGLVLTVQNGALRAVPEESAKSKKSILLKLKPGNKEKDTFVEEIRVLLKNKFSRDQILSAIPAGGLEVSK